MEIIKNLNQSLQKNPQSVEKKKITQIEKKIQKSLEKSQKIKKKIMVGQTQTQQKKS